MVVVTSAYEFKQAGAKQLCYEWHTSGMFLQAIVYVQAYRKRQSHMQKLVTVSHCLFIFRLVQRINRIQKLSNNQHSFPFA
ncbi:MAG: hypothetical protein HC862_03215 [Scytonema sp. RU_4_4]|nr:hypothetical protein [Scytonema sp. RU_4_4]